MEINQEQLKSQTTEALKALLDYSIKHRDYFTSTIVAKGLAGGSPTASSLDPNSLTMYSNYSEIVRVLEDELGKRLEDIFIF